MEKIKKLTTHKYFTFTCILSLFLVSWLVDRKSTSEVPVTKTELAEPGSADTFIPAGFVLVPIEIQNSENLDSLLGKYGVVDVYTKIRETDAAIKLIAEKVKILRAPLNPNVFAVLVPQGESNNLLKYPGPFWVSLQNPKALGTKFVKGKGSRSRILQENIEGLE